MKKKKMRKLRMIIAALLSATILASAAATTVVMATTAGDDTTIVAENGTEGEGSENSSYDDVIGNTAILGWYADFAYSSNEIPDYDTADWVEYDTLVQENNSRNIEFEILDVYYDSANGYLWYQVAPRDGNPFDDGFPLSGTPWILQNNQLTDDLGSYWAEPSLIVLEKGEGFVDGSVNIWNEGYGDYISYRVVASGADIPDNAELSVSEISAPTDTSFQLGFGTYVSYLDITITYTDENGVVQEYHGPVTITIPSNAIGLAADKYFAVVHDADDNDVFEEPTDELIGPYKTTSGLESEPTATFTASSLSPFYIADIDDGLEVANRLVKFKDNIPKLYSSFSGEPWTPSEEYDVPETFTVLYEVTDDAGNTWYWLDFTVWNTENSKNYWYAKPDDIELVSEDEEEADTNVVGSTATIKDGTTSITLYVDPTDLTAEGNSQALGETEMTDLPEIFVITNTYVDETTGKVYYRIDPAVRFNWPDAYDNFHYIDADYIQVETDLGLAEPIVDFINAAPIIQSAAAAQAQESAVYSARSASPFAVAAAEDDTTSSSTTVQGGLVLDKKVTDTDGDGIFTVNLEAYSTGTVTTQSKTVPMDIVVVVDQSGSMAQCIECGDMVYDGDTHGGETIYEEEYNVTSNSSHPTYYVVRNGEYTQVEWCSDCNTWHRGNIRNHRGNYLPKTSATDNSYNRTQFYIENGTTPVENCHRRLDALDTALKNFVDTVEDKTLDEKGEATVDHRIAVVGFSSSPYNNTELLTGVTITQDSDTDIEDNYINYYPHDNAYNGVQYGSITTAQYQNALQDVSKQSGQDNVDAAINALTAHGGTNTLDGLDMAYKILENDTKKDDDGREKVVILFTDGATNSTRSSVLNKAHDIKDDFDATVYSVGIFSGANGDPSSYEGNINDDNSLMHLISSNYPDAYYQTGYNGGIRDDDFDTNIPAGTSYYLSASDADALNNIFQSISSQLGSTSVTLGTESVVKDIVTPYFDLPANASAVTAKVYDCIGYGDDTEPDWEDDNLSENLGSDAVTLDTEKNTVNVTGFSFKDNYVAATGRDENDPTKTGDFYGRKLVITFDITPDPDFLGGNDVDTNGETSGVYANDKAEDAVAEFVLPDVDVPVKAIDNEVVDMDIYLGDGVDLTDIIDFDDRIDGTNNDYVDVTYTVNLPDGKTATYVIPKGELPGSDKCQWISDGTLDEARYPYLTDDKTYEVECLVDGGTNNIANTESGEATIRVFKPTITFNDTIITLGETADYAKNGGSVVWLHGADEAKTETMGAAPTLEYTYDPVAGAFTDDTPINVTVTSKRTIGNETTTRNITDAVNFKHDDCNFVANCPFNKDNEEFIVHVLKYGDLKITKNVTDDNYEEGDTFVFNVTGPNNFDFTVTISGQDITNGKNSVTIKDLPLGIYTVTEDTDWSWRYTVNGGAQKTATISAAALDQEVKFENEKTENQWLDYNTFADNIFDAVISNS